MRVSVRVRVRSGALTSVLAERIEGERPEEAVGDGLARAQEAPQQLIVKRVGQRLLRQRGVAEAKDLAQRLIRVGVRARVRARSRVGVRAGGGGRDFARACAMAEGIAAASGRRSASEGISAI
jgi:hypothetical protein